MKKYIFMMAFLCLKIQVFGQVDSSYRVRMDYLLQSLNPARVTTGILYDRVEPWADLRDFGHRAKPDTSNLVHYWQARFELLGASYRSNMADSIALTDLARENVASLNRKVIPIGGLLSEFEIIDTNAIHNGTIALQQDKLVVDVAKSGDSYLITRRSFVGTLLAGSLQPGAYVFKADPTFWSSNTSVSIRNWVIYKNNQVLDSLTPGDSINVDLLEPGQQTFAILARTSDGDSHISYSTLTVESIEATENEWDKKDDDPYWFETPKFQPCGGIRSTKITATIEFRGYNQNDQALFGEAEYTIYKRTEDENNCGLGSVRKPIIILDGFDPGDARKSETLYGKYLRYLEDPNDPSSNQYLGNKVRSDVNQYDIILLNFITWHTPNGVEINGGADYVERNARVLIELIKKVNKALSDNGSTEKLVIIGPSMGGLISRYALAYMEKEQLAHPDDATWDHRCRLWISFDSPQQGANIAIGPQHFLKFFAENNVPEAKHELDYKLGSIAARQMLLLHNTAGNTTAEPSSPYRAQFLSNLLSNGKPNSDGWPQNCRRIALVNGSISGVKIGHNCESGTKVEAFATFRAWRLFNWLYRQVFRESRIAYGKTFTIGGQDACTVFDGYRFQGSPVSRTVSLASAVSGNTGIDIGPGGTFPIFNELNTSNSTLSHSPIPLPIDFKYIVGGIIGNLPGIAIAFIASTLGTNQWNTIGGHSFGLGVKTRFTTDQVNCSFIPTKSALAFHWNRNDKGDWAEPLNDRNLFCSGEIPFHAYFGENLNSEHVSLTKKKVDWVLDEINNVATAASVQSVNIVGKSEMCGGTNGIQQTVTVPYSFSGSQNYWVGGPGVNIISGQGTPQVSISTEPDFQNSWISFSSSSNAYGCICKGEKPLSNRPQDVTLKCGSYYGDVTQGFQFCNNYPFRLHIASPGPWSDPTTQVTWERTGANTYNMEPTFINGSKGIKIDPISPQSSPNITFQVKVDIGCGLSNLYVKNFSFYFPSSYPEPGCIACPSDGLHRVSPNPAIKGQDLQITVTADDVVYPTFAYIKDERGTILDKLEVTQSPFSFPISRLEDAEYLVVIDQGKKPIEIPFLVSKTGTDKMVISPNPLFREVDETAVVNITDAQNEDSEFDVVLEDIAGRQYLNFRAYSRKFPIDVKDLPIGSYVLTATGATSTFQESPICG
jgi:hypothetical protein